MSFVTDALFGKSPEAIAPERLVGLFDPSREQVFSGIPEEGFGTPFSTLNPRSGALSVDPLGRNLNLQGLDNFSSRIGQTRESLVGNQGAFINARVSPLLERLQAGRGQLQRGLGRTGVRGTFADRSLQDFDINAARAEGQARSLARQETDQAITALDQMLFGAETGVGQNVFNQEITSLGLSAEVINNLRAIAANLATNSGSSAVASQNNVNNNEIARAEGVRSTIGSLFNEFG